MIFLLIRGIKFGGFIFLLYLCINNREDVGTVAKEGGNSPTSMKNKIIWKILRIWYR